MTFALQEIRQLQITKNVIKSRIEVDFFLGF